MAQKKPSLLDIMEKEQTSDNSNSSTTVKRKSATLDITSARDGSKDKQISAKVNEKSYALFTKINKAQGLSNNSALNLIINKYVRENKGILEDDNII